MAEQDQDIEIRLKCLKTAELAELLDFVIPNRTLDRDQAKSGQSAPQGDAQRPN